MAKTVVIETTVIERQVPAVGACRLSAPSAARELALVRRHRRRAHAVNKRQYVNELVSACLREPEIAPAQVEKLPERSRTASRWAALAASGAAADYRRLAGSHLSRDERAYAAMRWRFERLERDAAELVAGIARRVREAALPSAAIATPVARAGEPRRLTAEASTVARTLATIERQRRLTDRALTGGLGTSGAIGALQKATAGQWLGQVGLQGVAKSLLGRTSIAGLSGGNRYISDLATSAVGPRVGDGWRGSPRPAVSGLLKSVVGDAVQRPTWLPDVSKGLGRLGFQTPGSLGIQADLLAGRRFAIDGVGRKLFADMAGRSRAFGLQSFDADLVGLRRPGVHTAIGGLRPHGLSAFSDTTLIGARLQALVRGATEGAGFAKLQALHSFRVDDLIGARMQGLIDTMRRNATHFVHLILREQFADEPVVYIVELAGVEVAVAYYRAAEAGEPEELLDALVPAVMSPHVLDALHAGVERVEFLNVFSHDWLLEGLRHLREDLNFRLALPDLFQGLEAALRDTARRDGIIDARDRFTAGSGRGGEAKGAEELVRHMGLDAGAELVLRTRAWGKGNQFRHGNAVILSSPDEQARRQAVYLVLALAIWLDRLGDPESMDRLIETVALQAPQPGHP